MANIRQDILDRLHEIFRTQAVISVVGTYLEDSTGSLTFSFSDGDEVSKPFKYTGVEVNNFIETLMDTGGKIILAYREQFNPPPIKVDFFAEVTE